MDKEIQVMSACLSELSNVDKESQNRIIEWLIKKLDLSSQSLTQVKHSFGNEQTSNDEVINFKGTNNEISDFDSVHDLFANIEAKYDSDKALVVGAFLQVKNGKADMSSREINAELKHMGHGISNITNALSNLINRKPQLIVQTKKGGTTRQAQKRYKVTSTGINIVKDAIATGKIKI